MKRYLIISIFAVLNTLCASLWAADSLSVSELKQRMQDGNAPIIIDVRDEDEYLAGHIPGAIMVPAKQMEHHLDMMEQYRKEHRAVLPIWPPGQRRCHRTGKCRLQEREAAARELSGLGVRPISTDLPITTPPTAYGIRIFLFHRQVRLSPISRRPLPLL